MNISLINWQNETPVFYPWLAALVLGWLMVASASTGIAEEYTGNPPALPARGKTPGFRSAS